MSAWKDAGLIPESSDMTVQAETEKHPVPTVAQDPRSPALQGTSVERTPIHVRDCGDERLIESDSTPPVATKVLAFDPRSPGVERSPIIIADDSGTPVRSTPVLKSKSLASKLNSRLRASQKAQ